MALTKVQKQKIIEELKEKVAKQKVIIFVNFSGLKVKDLFNLRKKLKMAGNELKVAKKTLMGIVFKKAKIEIEPKKLAGELALVFGYKDEISPAKILWQFTELNPNLKILGGFFGNKFRGAEEIIALAKLPLKEELLAGLVGSLSAPITNFLNVLQGNLRKLIHIISQLKVNQ